MLRIGYLDEWSRADESVARVDALAAILAANAPLALAGLKRAINEIAAGRLDRTRSPQTRAPAAPPPSDHAEAAQGLGREARAGVSRPLRRSA